MVKRKYRKCIHDLICANKCMNKANPEYKNYLPNCYRGRLKFNNPNKWEFNESDFETPDSNDRILVFILESPHIDEFDEEGNPQKPLVNIECFKKNIDRLLRNKLNPKNTYSVYLMNAIKLQCSLGLPTTYVRDFVFLYYWGKGESTAFEKELYDFIQNNNKKIEYVINTVTIGSHKNVCYLYNNSTQEMDFVFKNCSRKFFNKVCSKQYNSLQDVVDESIDNVFNKLSINIPIRLKGTHPSGWYAKNAKIY